MRWESELDRYHAMSTERLPETILVAILIQHAPTAIRQHLQLNAASLAHNYQRTRDAVETFLLSTRSWPAAGAGSSDGATPTEVDALWIKGKGKDKGKDKKGDEETRTCFTCGKPGHLSTACWYRDNSTEKETYKG